MAARTWLPYGGPPRALEPFPIMPPLLQIVTPTPLKPFALLLHPSPAPLCTHFNPTHAYLPALPSAPPCSAPRDQAVLYNLFDWPTHTASRLAVMGISNTHDLDQRVLPRIARCDPCATTPLHLVPPKQIRTG